MFKWSGDFGGSRHRHRPECCIASCDDPTVRRDLVAFIRLHGMIAHRFEMSLCKRLGGSRIENEKLIQLRDRRRPASARRHSEASLRSRTTKTKF